MRKRNSRVLPISYALIVVLAVMALTSNSFAFSGLLQVILPDTITSIKQYPVFSELVNPAQDQKTGVLENRIHLLFASERAFSSAA